MRKRIRTLGLALVLGLVSGTATAQQAVSFFTPSNPQALQFRPIDTSNLIATPPPPIVQQSKPFSLTNLVSPPPAIAQQPKSFSLTSLVSSLKLPSFSSIFGHNATPPVFPGQLPNGFAPVLPTTILPGQHPDAIHPVLPTTKLPPPGHPDAIFPVLPTTKLPPPRQPDAIKPLLPFTPNQ
jgi:hypothetical protein